MRKIDINNLYIKPLYTGISGITSLIHTMPEIQGIVVTLFEHEYDDEYILTYVKIKIRTLNRSQKEAVLSNVKEYLNVLRNNTE